MVNYLVLLVAIIVAGVAAYFSVFGIGLIFAGSFVAAVVMGCALEAAKITAVSWLYRHWSYAHWLLKTYLIGAIVVLSLITSLGIFGFLSRAHIEQISKLETSDISNIGVIDDQIAQHKASIADIDKRVALIDDALRDLIAKGRARDSLRYQEDQDRIRKTLNKDRTNQIGELNELTKQKTKITNENTKAQVEVGPIRYVAEFFFNNSDPTTLERAVRWMIIVIILVFDPLSIALFIAYNTMAVAKKDLTLPGDPNIILVNKKHIKDMT
jgi:hypothetical protein